jgi:hypothetical protein
MRPTAKTSLVAAPLIFSLAADCFAFAGYGDGNGFRSAMEKILGPGACTTSGQSVDCRSSQGSVPVVHVGLQPGGFTLAISPPTQEGPVKYSDLANALQYGARSSLHDRFPTYDDVLRICGAAANRGCVFESPDTKNGVRRLQISYANGTANASAMLSIGWTK